MIIFILLFYRCTYQSMAAMNLVGQRVEEEINIDSLPPPSPELLPEDGAVPDTRQQEVDNQFASSRDQAMQELTSKRETVHMPPSDKAALANATLSKPIQVKLVWVYYIPVI